MGAKLLRIVAVTVFVVGITLFLAEIGLRIYLSVAPDPSGSPYVRDEHAEFRLRPTPVEDIKPGSEDYINQFGFRDQNHPIDKPLTFAGSFDDPGNIGHYKGAIISVFNNAQVGYQGGKRIISNFGFGS